MPPFAVPALDPLSSLPGFDEWFSAARHSVHVRREPEQLELSAASERRMLGVDGGTLHLLAGQALELRAAARVKPHVAGAVKEPTPLHLSGTGPPPSNAHHAGRAAEPDAPPLRPTPSPTAQRLAPDMPSTPSEEEPAASTQLQAPNAPAASACIRPPVQGTLAQSLHPHHPIHRESRAPLGAPPAAAHSRCGTSRLTRAIVEAARGGRGANPSVAADSGPSRRHGATGAASAAHVALHAKLAAPDARAEARGKGGLFDPDLGRNMLRDDERRLRRESEQREQQRAAGERLPVRDMEEQLLRVRRQLAHDFAAEPTHPFVKAQLRRLRRLEGNVKALKAQRGAHAAAVMRNYLEQDLLALLRDTLPAAAFDEYGFAGVGAEAEPLSAGAEGAPPRGPVSPSGSAAAAWAAGSHDAPAVADHSGLNARPACCCRSSCASLDSRREGPSDGCTESLAARGQPAPSIASSGRADDVEVRAQGVAAGDEAQSGALSALTAMLRGLGEAQQRQHSQLLTLIAPLLPDRAATAAAEAAAAAASRTEHYSGLDDGGDYCGWMESDLSRNTSQLHAPFSVLQMGCPAGPHVLSRAPSSVASSVSSNGKGSARARQPARGPACSPISSSRGTSLSSTQSQLKPASRQASKGDLFTLRTQASRSRQSTAAVSGCSAAGATARRASTSSLPGSFTSKRGCVGTAAMAQRRPQLGGVREHAGVPSTVASSKCAESPQSESAVSERFSLERAAELHAALGLIQTISEEQQQLWDKWIGEERAGSGGGGRHTGSGGDGTVMDGGMRAAETKPQNIDGGACTPTRGERPVRASDAGLTESSRSASSRCASLDSESASRLDGGAPAGRAATNAHSPMDEGHSQTLLSSASCREAAPCSSQASIEADSFSRADGEGLASATHRSATAKVSSQALLAICEETPREDAAHPHARGSAPVRAPCGRADVAPQAALSGQPCTGAQQAAPRSAWACGAAAAAAQPRANGARASAPAADAVAGTVLPAEIEASIWQAKSAFEADLRTSGMKEPWQLAMQLSEDFLDELLDAAAADLYKACDDCVEVLCGQEL